MILTCLTVAILNITDLPLDSRDFKAIARSEKVCGSKNKWLKVFEKREPGLYRSYCGEPQSFDKKEFDKAELDMIRWELRHLDKDAREKALKKLEE